MGVASDGRIRDAALFFRDYAGAIYAAGATTIRIEQNLERMARAWNVDADFSILPTALTLTVWDKEGGESFTVTGRVPADKINFSTVTSLSRLSWAISDTGMDPKAARPELESVLGAKRINPYLVLVLTGLANASFCELFGGDPVSMLIVFVATVQGFYLKQKLPDTGLDYRIATLVAACVSAIISCSGFVFGWGVTHDTALATSVLYLVPGIPFSNAVSDVIHGKYLCAISRFMHAVIITICLSLGLCLAFLILNLKFY